MLGIFVDIDNELDEIDRELTLLTDAVALVEERAPQSDSAWEWLAIQGLASGIEKTYTGMERVMARIADVIDGAAVGRGAGWHVSLLRRMAHPFPGMRSAVISEECFEALDRLRAFRHRQRHSYGMALDPAIVVPRAKEARPAFDMFRAEMARFADTLAPRQDGDAE